MKVIDSFELRGRGTVIHIETVPDEKYYIGQQIEFKDKQWKIVGVEHIRQCWVPRDNPELGLLVVEITT